MSEEKNPDLDTAHITGTLIKKTEAAHYLAEILPELARIANMAHLTELSDRLMQASALAVNCKGQGK